MYAFINEMDTLIFYYLFGEDACRYYSEINSLTPKKAAKIKEMGGVVFKYDDRLNTPDDLLAAYDGYMGYTPITQEDYNLLIN